MLETVAYTMIAIWFALVLVHGISRAKRES